MNFFNASERERSFLMVINRAPNDDTQNEVLDIEYVIIGSRTTTD